MKLSRRDALAFGGAAIAVTLVPVPFAQASTEATVAAVKEFAAGADVGEGGIELTTPEIAENGNTVPIEVSAPGAKRIMVLAEGNPNPGVVTFNFGPLANSSASIRVRLAGTQNVIAVAEMPDGTYMQVAKAVKVTIGGCGG